MYIHINVDIKKKAYLEEVNFTSNTHILIHYNFNNIVTAVNKIKHIQL